MKRLAVVLIALGACGLTPQEQAERDFRQARMTDDVRRRLELLDRVIELCPTIDAHLERALLSETARDPDRAIADLTAALRFVGEHPARATLFLSRGLLYGKARRYEEADADLSLAIKATGSPEAYLERAWFRRQAGKAADADSDVATARRDGADLADPFYNQGVRAVKKGNSAEAEHMFRFALDLQPLHAGAHVGMARLYMERHEFAKAVAEFEQAMPADCTSAELFYHRGNARLAAGAGGDALADFTKAIELAPKEAIYWAARGLAQHRVRHDAERAMADFAEAIKLDPNCHQAWQSRGLLDHEQGQLEGAEADLRKALSIHATPEGCEALGRVLHDRGEYDKALALYAQTLQIYKEPDVQKKIAAEAERTRRAKESQK
jgi:tetratricopeptide (TPR) repeat protein